MSWRLHHSSTHRLAFVLSLASFRQPPFLRYVNHGQDYWQGYTTYIWWSQCPSIKVTLDSGVHWSWPGLNRSWICWWSRIMVNWVRWIGLGIVWFYRIDWFIGVWGSVRLRLQWIYIRGWHVRLMCYRTQYIAHPLRFRLEEHGEKENCQ